MARASFSTAMIALGFLLVTLMGQCEGVIVRNGLQPNFYNGKCNKINVEAIVYFVVKKHFDDDADTVADLVRLVFHDCWIRGCDASILLEGPTAEKTAAPNLSVAGFDIIEEAKIILDKQCPGVVSCADIINLAARAAVFLGGANWYDVSCGRKDGRISNATEALNGLPSPRLPVPLAVNAFAARGLSAEDFVVLLGCHTVGKAHCANYEDRIWNFRNSNKADPTMNPELLKFLKKQCPRNAHSNNQDFLDQTKGSEFVMDNQFYRRILEGKGILEIDQGMALAPQTRDLVIRLAGDPKIFAKEISEKMETLSRLDVLLQGEVRLGTCKSVRR